MPSPLGRAAAAALPFWEVRSPGDAHLFHGWSFTLCFARWCFGAAPIPSAVQSEFGGLVQVGFYALRKVRKGEELAYDYGPAYMAQGPELGRRCDQF